ncbi:uncharacterized protein LOC133360949 [Lethenteron reissneri]|uniref:uncharacterized protein LOC133360949 n=1 Tax=Lethenteron reissneri TaxID=7753 RepID=UPI002AB5FD89|nr:uncharacterized protein LOC133360949 [Lethenteron reissneri]
MSAPPGNREAVTRYRMVSVLNERLSFERGQKMRLLSPSAEREPWWPRAVGHRDGTAGESVVAAWCLCQDGRGRVGLVSRDYLDMRGGDGAIMEPAPRLPNGRTSSTSTTSTSTTTSTTTSSTTSSSSGDTFRATADVTQTAPWEVSLCRGELLAEVVERSTETWWRVRRKDGIAGFVRRECLEAVPAARAPLPHAVPWQASEDHKSDEGDADSAGRDGAMCMAFGSGDDGIYIRLL